VLIPNQATQISQRGPFVYVVKSDDTAELRPVRLGQRQGEQIVITEGIAPNERVVLAGQMLVRPGGKVRVDGSSSDGANASGGGNAASGGQS
jgi:membrane fusion protein, multidrug efflux system